MNPDPRRWIALTVIAAAQLMVVLDGSIVNIALPSAQADLGISDADRQWVVTAYVLAFGGLLLLGGRIADQVGRKKVFVIGLLGFAAASALGGFAVNSGMLIGARGLQGVFAALLAPSALSLVTVTFTDMKERHRAFGVYGAVSGGGAAIGLVLGGVLTEYASWRWCLLVNVPIAIIAALAAIPTVRESKITKGTRYDIAGAILVTGGLTAIVYGFTRAADPGAGWGNPLTVSLLLGGIIILAAFVFVETRAQDPLVPLRLVLHRNRAGVFLSSLLIFAGLFSMFLFLSYYFQQNLGFTPLLSGLAFLPFSAGIAVSAVGGSGLVHRFGPKPLLVFGATLGAIGLAYLLFLNEHSTYLLNVLPAEVLISIGMGLSSVAQYSLAQHGVAEKDVGVVSALLNTAQQIGGALGLALLNTVYAAAVASYLLAHKTGATAHSLAALSGYQQAFLVGMIMLLAAALIVSVLVKRDRTVSEPIPTAVHA
ncbi:MFS transporter [Lysinimonas soli]|uniref:MFS transporter n=1 Tax=Lysinimonas soli TaxID=1074233 RepID=A0ABW0NUM1_9MICO